MPVFFSNGLGCHMPCESLDEFWETGTYSRARDGCHVSTFPGWGMTKGDSNHLNSDSNHLLYRSINCSTCTLQQLDFLFESLSQRLVKALQRSLMID